MTNMKLAAANPTPATGQALRKVFQLLEDNFDTDAGCFKNDYGDERIAKETGISLDAVKNYRTSAFGKLKPPTDLVLIERDLRELESLYLKTESEMKSALKDLQARMRNVQRRFD